MDFSEIKIWVNFGMLPLNSRINNHNNQDYGIAFLRGLNSMRNELGDNGYLGQIVSLRPHYTERYCDL